MIDSTLVELMHSLIARTGITTADGNAGGSSIFDAGLIGFGANSYVSMTLQIYPGVPDLVDTRDITGFNNATGEVTVGSPYKQGQVLAGTPYKVLTFRPAIAEVHGVFTVLPSCPDTVEPDTAQDLSLSLSTVEGIPAAANLQVGTITIVRVRAGAETTIINAVACTAADGRIYYDYAFPVADWQAGDEYKATFNGQAVTVGATMYALSGIRCKGRVSREASIPTIETDTDPLVMGRLQIAHTTIDLNQGIASYDLFTGTTQDVVVERLVIRMPDAVCGGALTSISIQTDDTTPQVFIDAATGAVANLTAEAQLAWTGAVIIDAGTGAKIQLTIAGGAHGVAYVCDVIAECRAVVSGGHLA